MEDRKWRTQEVKQKLERSESATHTGRWAAATGARYWVHRGPLRAQAGCTTDQGELRGSFALGTTGRSEILQRGGGLLMEVVCPRPVDEAPAGPSCTRRAGRLRRRYRRQARCWCWWRPRQKWGPVFYLFPTLLFFFGINCLSATQICCQKSLVK